MSKALIILLQSTLLWVVGLAQAGLWHGTDDKTGNTTFFLYLNGEKSRLYGPDWAGVDGISVDGDHLKFRLPYKTYGIKCSGQLKEGSIKGSWEIQQVQFVSKGTWSARKVFTVEGWDPWDFLQSGKPVIDIVGRLGDCNLESYAAFEAFWDQEIEPDFFALLTLSLYADENGDYQLKIKDRKLSEIYKLVRSEKSLRKHNEQLLEAIPQIGHTLKETYPWLKPVPAVVSTFSLGDFDYRFVRVGEQRFLLFGADWNVKQSDENAMRKVVAEGLVASFHYSVVPMSSRGQFEIVRRSIATYLLDSMGREEFKLSFDPKTTEAAVSVRDSITKDFRSSHSEFFPKYLTGGARLQTYRIFYDLGHFLAKDRELEELFELKGEELARGVMGFFGTGH